jgi:hypothetical protein
VRPEAGARNDDLEAQTRRFDKIVEGVAARFGSGKGGKTQTVSITLTGAVLRCGLMQCLGRHAEGRLRFLQVYARHESGLAFLSPDQLSAGCIDEVLVQEGWDVLNIDWARAASSTVPVLGQVLPDSGCGERISRGHSWNGRLVVGSVLGFLRRDWVASCEHSC